LDGDAQVLVAWRWCWLPVSRRLGLAAWSDKWLAMGDGEMFR